MFPMKELTINSKLQYANPIRKKFCRNDTMTKKLRVMLVSHPGTWQKMLKKKIESHQHVGEIEVVSGSLSASQLVKDAQSDLILIDSSIPFDDALVLVHIVNLENPGIRSMIITDTTKQRRRVLQVGVDFVASSFNVETQIEKVLDQLSENLQNGMENPTRKFNADPNLEVE